MVLVVLVAVILCIIFFTVDYVDGTVSQYIERTTGQYVIDLMTWAPFACTLVACLAGFYIFYILAPYAVYHHSKRHGRNTVRWTTAFVVFTPVLAGVAYLLTWPKEKKPTGLE